MKETSPFVVIAGVILGLALIVQGLFLARLSVTLEETKAMVENINGHPLYQPPAPPQRPYAPYVYPRPNGSTGSTGAIGDK